jgi:hypothetical protein
MERVKKTYHYTLIFRDIDRFEVEEDVRDVYFPITKKAMEQRKQFFPSMTEVMEPRVNFFHSHDNQNCMAALYGYVREVKLPLEDEGDREGQELWITILQLILSFVGTMQNTHEFELYAYGMAFDESEYGWFDPLTKDQINTEDVYQIFPKKYLRR